MLVPHRTIAQLHFDRSGRGAASDPLSLRVLPQPQLPFLGGFFVTPRLLPLRVLPQSIVPLVLALLHAPQLAPLRVPRQPPLPLILRLLEPAQLPSLRVLPQPFLPLSHRLLAMTPRRSGRLPAARLAPTAAAGRREAHPVSVLLVQPGLLRMLLVHNPVQRNLLSISVCGQNRGVRESIQIRLVLYAWGAPVCVQRQRGEDPVGGTSSGSLARVVINEVYLLHLGATEGDRIVLRVAPKVTLVRLQLRLTFPAHRGHCWNGARTRQLVINRQKCGDRNQNS